MPISSWGTLSQWKRSWYNLDQAPSQKYKSLLATLKTWPDIFYAVNFFFFCLKTLSASASLVYNRKKAINRSNNQPKKPKKKVISGLSSKKQVMFVGLLCYHLYQKSHGWVVLLEGCCPEPVTHLCIFHIRGFLPLKCILKFQLHCKLSKACIWISIQSYIYQKLSKNNVIQYLKLLGCTKFNWLQTPWSSAR